MSLSSLIKNDKSLRNKIGDDFQLSVLRQRIEKTRPLLASPNTTNHQLVGTAFDYLLRFYLERLNELPYHSENQWVAEKARNILFESCESTQIERFECLEQESIEIHQCSQRESMIAYALSIHYPDSVLLSAYEHSLKIIEKVKCLRKEFTETGRLSREFIRQTLCMAYIDPVLRSGRGVECIGTDADKLDIEDIEKQFFLIDDKLFKSKNRCLLNPIFGKGSQLVGGADADLIIDDKLIDVKTTKKLELPLSDFCQIIGYLLLHRIGGTSSCSGEFKIEQLGIYYSRYGYLFLFNVKDLISENSLNEFTKWFENYVRKEKRETI